MSLMAWLLSLFLRSGQKRIRRIRNPVFLRRGMELSGRLTAIMPLWVRREDIRVAGMPVRVLHNRRTSARPGHVLFYLHGGGFVAGSPDTHQAFVARLMIAGGFASAWLPDYRLAPEHAFPAAIEDALAAWQAVSAHQDSKHIHIGGESAGGNLALLLCQHIRDRGLRRPERAYLLSPWLDLGLASEDPGPDFREDLMIGRDPVSARAWVREVFAGAYAPGQRLDNPALSPVYGRLDDLPPLLVQAGSNEIFAADCLLLRRLGETAGADIHLEIWKGMPHAFAFFGPWLPEANAATRRAGTWLAQAEAAPAQRFQHLISDTGSAS